MSARTVIASAGALLGIGAAAVGIGAVTGLAGKDSSNGPVKSADLTGTSAMAAQGCGVLQPGASAVAQHAVSAACGQIGVWYSWGGGHGSVPGASYGHYDGQDPDSRWDGQRKGFDCSGLMRYAYYQATGSDILNGTANDQFHTSRAVARFSPAQGSGPLLPGDLMFWGAGHAHHVAMYIGNGQMVEAYESGTHIRVTSVRLGGDYAGAVRINGSGTPAPPPPGNGGGKYWVDTFQAATGYAGANTANAQGVLNKGRNYVYCKVWGAQVGSGSQFNRWWLRTDLDRAFAGKNGRGAYVSAYYLARWGNDEAKDVNGTVIPNC
jgi:cell wall-associated NlpC family hydrolase